LYGRRGERGKGGGKGAGHPPGPLACAPVTAREKGKKKEKGISPSVALPRERRKRGGGDTQRGRLVSSKKPGGRRGRGKRKKLGVLADLLTEEKEKKRKGRVKGILLSVGGRQIGGGGGR